MADDATLPARNGSHEHMLARIQQTLTLGALLLAALWAVLSLQAGYAGWALGGVLLLLGGYAGVLALEFGLLRRLHGSDPTPRATAGQLLRAWWCEVLSAPRVFCWNQPFRSHLFPDHLPTQARGRPGVLFVHGFVCNRGLWNSWMKRLLVDGVPYVAVTMEPPFGTIDDGVATIEQGVRLLEDCTGQPPVLVAHSMGGLALRRWWADHGSEARVQHAITIGTPHQGTWLARFALSLNGRQMRPGSEWLAALAAAQPPGLARKFTCFYSHCDNIVFPPAAATMPGADNRHLPGVAHVHMAEHQAPWLALQALLSRPARLDSHTDLRQM